MEEHEYLVQKKYWGCRKKPLNEFTIWWASPPNLPCGPSIFFSALNQNF